MANPSRPRRPSSGSRTPTSRPRKVAGRSTTSPLTSPEPDEGTEGTEGDVEAQTPSDSAVNLAKQSPAPPVDVEVEEENEVESEVDPEGEVQEPEVAAEGRRLTPVLVAAIVALVLVLSGEAYYLAGPPAAAPVVSVSRPVVATDVERASAVETAAASIEKIVARSYLTYDEEVEAATATMTDTFAQQYRETTSQIKDAFVESKTEVTVTVVAQAVMTASPQQAQVLLFLNQFVTKDGGEALYSPYRAVATMVKTEQGWLVDKIDTK